MMDTWTPHTVDHAATYYQRKRDSNLEDIEKCRDMVFPNISRNKSAPRTQRRRGSYGDLEGGITGQSRHKQHQISAEDLMTKKRTRRHSASESTNTVIIKRYDWTFIDEHSLTNFHLETRRRQILITSNDPTTLPPREQAEN